MRQLVNNFLYGETSQLLAGRFDTDIYKSGCQHLENFNVMVQGGVTRRPPKRLLHTISSGSKLLNYTIDTTNSMMVILNGSNVEQGISGTISLYNFSDDEVISLIYENDNPWKLLTDEQLKNTRSVVYYTDLIMVNPDAPLLRIRPEGTNFRVERPTLIFNQDSPAWNNHEIAYGMDDFKECHLNQSEGNYASICAIIGERLWLASTRLEPYKIWASRVAETSQVVIPTHESDNLFDFIQFQVVETESSTVNASKVPVVPDGNYVGTAWAQKMWKLPMDAADITTLDVYTAYKEEYSLRVEMIPDTTKVNKIDIKQNGEWVSYITFSWSDELEPTASLTATGDLLTVDYEPDSLVIKKLSLNNIVYASIIPNYVTDLNNLNDMFDISTELTLTATDSTSMEFQLASGRNDKVTWIGAGDYIMVGTESACWRISLDITALDFSSNMYSSNGSSTGLHVNIGTDLVFLERGNKSRLLYQNDYGLQTMNLSLTNPEILEGKILEMKAINTDTPQIYLLKEKNGVRSVVCLSLDRADGVQGWSEWTFTSGTISSIEICENSDKQYLCALIKDDVNYLCKFDTDEKELFADCSVVDNEVEDSTESYESKMVTNCFETETDNGTTFGDNKRIDKVYFRCFNSGEVLVGTDKHIDNLTRFEVSPQGVGDFFVNIDGGSSKEIAIHIKANKDKPLNLLCMAYDVRISN